MGSEIQVNAFRCSSGPGGYAAGGGHMQPAATPKSNCGDILTTLQLLRNRHPSPPPVTLMQKCTIGCGVETQ